MKEVLIEGDFSDRNQDEKRKRWELFTLLIATFGQNFASFIGTNITSQSDSLQNGNRKKSKKLALTLVCFVNGERFVFFPSLSGCSFHQTVFDQFCAFLLTLSIQVFARLAKRETFNSCVFGKPFKMFAQSVKINSLGLSS